MTKSILGRHSNSAPVHSRFEKAMLTAIIVAFPFVLCLMTAYVSKGDDAGSQRVRLLFY